LELSAFHYHINLNINMGCGLFTRLFRRSKPQPAPNSEDLAPRPYPFSSVSSSPTIGIEKRVSANSTGGATLVDPTEKDTVVYGKPDGFNSRSASVSPSVQSGISTRPAVNPQFSAYATPLGFSQHLEKTAHWNEKHKTPHDDSDAPAAWEKKEDAIGEEDIDAMKRKARMEEVRREAARIADAEQERMDFFQMM
jgi:hypothetical protein